jgi:hypothetical protein
MKSSGVITLFHEQRYPSQPSYSFFVSILMHGVGIGLVALGILSTPPIQQRTAARRYELRHLELHVADAQSAAGDSHYPDARARSLGKASPAQEQAAPPPVLHEVAQAGKAKQTLVQPDLPAHIELAEETPVPAMVIWTPPKVHVKTIVAPQPEKPTAADVKPSLVTPNQEVTLAEHGISSSNLATRPQPLVASTTSPVEVHAPDRPQLPPVTVTQQAATPTPAAVLSLSDLHMKDGNVTLPPVNQTAAKPSKEPATQGKSKATPAAKTSANGDPASKSSGNGGDKAPSNAKKAEKVAENGGKQNAKPSVSKPVEAKAVESKAGAGKPAEAHRSGAASGPAVGMDEASDSKHAHITRPIDGHFGAVIVGSTLEEQYPDIGDQWQGRLAYTVNLHVGTAKSWILQYSAPRNESVGGAGSVSRIDAPWPYSIVRPNLAPGSINADALLVHGFVNQVGRFESLTIAFPPEFAQSQFVLDALRQWQFRPAAQNGQPARVEVLIIIPEVE